MKEKIGRLLNAIFNYPKVIYVAVVLAVVVSLPALDATMMMDDYMQRYLVYTDPAANPYKFYRVGSELTDEAMQSGLLPWWLHPDSKLEFYRPVAHALLLLDYKLWPESLAMMHFHSILWYALLVLIVGLVYRRLLPTPLAVGMATVMFVIDYGHGGAVAWLCNRNVLVAMSCSMLAFLCYMRDDWRWQIPGAILFAVSFACAEAALSITGYFFAYEVFLRKKSWSFKIIRLALYAAISVGWLVYWKLGDYGSSGPGFYTDPMSDPSGFLYELIFRAPAFVVGEFLSIPLEYLAFLGLTPYRWHTWVVIIALALLLLRLFWPVLKANAVARFLLLGMVISALPICGSQLVSRLQWYVSFGGLGLIALFFMHYLALPDKPRRSVSIFAVVLLVLHFIISPLIFWHGMSQINAWSRYLDTQTINLPNDQKQPGKVLLLSTYMWELGTTLPMIKDMSLSLGPDASRPPSSISDLRLLTAGMGEFTLTRKDTNTLVATSEEGFDGIRYGVWGFDPGEVYTTDDMSIRILEVSEKRAPSVIEYEFKPGTLEEYTVMAWEGNQYETTTLPEPGESRVIVTEIPQFE